MPDKDPAAMFDATGDAAAEDPAAEDPDATDPGAEAHADGDPAGVDRAAGATETLADRRARAARIRERSLELIEALGADHPLVVEALARADALDTVTVERREASGHPARAAATGGDTDKDADADADAIDLRSSADLPH
ncbi:MAG: hypothetical protein ACE367_11085 [Acidimicrobiales bacterium]